MDDYTELEMRTRREREGAPFAQLDDILSEMRDVKSVLLQVREVVGVLVRTEKCAEVKTEVAARRLDRIEQEKDLTKVVKLVVDKWFVDQRFGFGKASMGEIVFIHASVVQGAEVLMVCTDAWAQIVSDHAHAEGRYRAPRAWGRNAWKEERDKEKANRSAQQVRRAAALSAELAAQSENKVSAVCDHTLGLRDELAEHIEALSMGAGGSHLQAKMMQEDSAALAATSLPFATPAVGSPVHVTLRLRAGRGV